VVKATDWLNLSKWVRVFGVRILEIEIVGAPSLRIGIFVPFGGDRKQRVGLVIHEVASDLIGAVRKAPRALVAGRSQKYDCRIDSTRADGEETRGIGRGVVAF